MKYTVSTLEFGPLDPGDADVKSYAESLLDGNFAYAEEAETPDGEYVVLNFPEEEVRFDFFIADKNLVREVRDENETLYKRVNMSDDTDNTAIMQNWYDALAQKAGKKD